MKVGVTGASGFIGRALCRDLGARGHEVVSPDGAEVVVHLAGRAHQRGTLEEFRRDNVGRALAAARSGARRLVFISSVKVHGETGTFSEADPPRPRGPYATSKWEAEQALARERGIEVVVLRPPLVYGPEVRANFLALLRAVDRGIPLPLASVHNRRSLIYLGNLTDALIACATRPAAAGETFLAADAEPVSTPDLIRALARALARPARLFRFPPFLLPARLAGTLAVDGGKIARVLGWRPPHSLEAGLAETARWWRTR